MNVHLVNHIKSPKFSDFLENPYSNLGRTSEASADIDAVSFLQIPETDFNSNRLDTDCVFKYSRLKNIDSLFLEC